MLAAANSLPPNWRLILGDGKKTAATITREQLKVLSGGGMDEAMTRALQEAKARQDARLAFIKELGDEVTLLKPPIMVGGAPEHSTLLFLDLIERAAGCAQKVGLTVMASALHKLERPPPGNQRPPAKDKWTPGARRAYFLTLPAILKRGNDETQRLYQEELTEIERRGRRKTGRGE